MWGVSKKFGGREVKKKKKGEGQLETPSVILLSIAKESECGITQPCSRIPVHNVLFKMTSSRISLVARPIRGLAKKMEDRVRN